MEGVFTEVSAGSLIAGALILAMFVAAVSVGGLREQSEHRRTEAQPLKKAA
jgi:hypothetical protein